MRNEHENVNWFLISSWGDDASWSNRPFLENAIYVKYKHSDFINIGCHMNMVLIWVFDPNPTFNFEGGGKIFKNMLRKKSDVGKEMMALHFNF